jgi:hypothetical protein
MISMDRKLMNRALRAQRLDLADLLVAVMDDDRDNMIGALAEAVTGPPGEALRIYIEAALEEWYDGVSAYVRSRALTMSAEVLDRRMIGAHEVREPVFNEPGMCPAELRGE